VNVLATLARTPNANTTPTSASRLAGLALTKSLASEVGPRGIRANAILIGLIESGQWVRRAADANVALEDFYATMAANAKIPLGESVALRSSPTWRVPALARASYVTGVGISIDGGCRPSSDAPLDRNSE